MQRDNAVKTLEKRKAELEDQLAKQIHKQVSDDQFGMLSNHELENQQQGNGYDTEKDSKDRAVVSTKSNAKQRKAPAREEEVCQMKTCLISNTSRVAL